MELAMIPQEDELASNQGRRWDIATPKVGSKWSLHCKHSPLRMLRCNCSLTQHKIARESCNAVSRNSE